MKRRLAARAAVSVVLAWAAVAALTLPATATSPKPPVATTLLEAMQRDLGLTPEQAKSRLAGEAVATRVDHLLQSTLGSAFGGAYYDSRLGKLVVGVTEPDRAGAIRGVGAEARTVEHSADQLDGVVSTLNAHLERAPNAVSGWYVDYSANSVVVTTAPGTADRAARFVRDSGAAAAAVRIAESAERPRTLADVVGGNAYYLNGGARCSIGFSVNGGFVTAGHCGHSGDATSQPSGVFAQSNFPGNDFAYVRVNHGETPRPLVNDYAGGVVGVAGSSEAPEGSSVCQSGSATGWHCGTIQAKNQTATYQQGKVTGLTRTNVCAEPGDSGGAWLSGNQAQGVTSGGWGDCGATYFQPINPILKAYGLTLLKQ